MMFDWGDLVPLSQELLAAPDTTLEPARHRTASNRAYYAAYHFILQRAVELGKFEPRGGAGDHGGLRAALKSNGGSHGKALAAMLEQLYKTREWADYEPSKNSTGRTAKDCVDLAVKAINSARTWR